MDEYLIYFDGSSRDRGRRGGPGFSAGAAVLVGKDGVLGKRSVFLRSADAHTAEFQGLLCGLQMALESKADSVRIFGDSRIVIDQILGLKASQNPEMIKQRDQVLDLLKNFTAWKLEWIPRRKNELADQEARRCLQGSGTISF